MKKIKQAVLLLLLFVSFAQTAATGVGPIAARAAGAEGLVKEKGKYYFYADGKKVKNQWETIGADRYYFGEDKAAVTGKKSGGIVIPKVCKIKGKSYGFDNKGRMVKGLYVIRNKFYLFHSVSGQYEASATNKLRAAAREGQNAKTLLALLKKRVGDPLSRENHPDSCYGDGKDSVLYYSGFLVQLFTSRSGKTTVIGVYADVRQEAPETETPETETPETETEAAAGAETQETEAGAAVDPPQPQPESGKTVVKRGLVQINGNWFFYKKDGTKLKKAWKTVNGKTYYFRKNGKAQTYSAKINGKIYVFDRKGRLQKGSRTRIVTVGLRKYCVDKAGCALTGWRVVGGKLYYADTKSGLLYQKRSYGGVKFSKSGAAENSVGAQLKIKTMSIVASITNSGMSKSQKLRACWNYVVGGRFSYGSRYPNLGQGGWQRETALHMLNNRWGNCYSFACAFAALAKEVGYYPYVICGRVSGSRDGAADGLTRHAWVQIDGAYYDPEAQYAGWARGIYGAGGYYVAHQIQARVAF